MGSPPNGWATSAISILLSYAVRFSDVFTCTRGACGNFPIPGDGQTTRNWVVLELHTRDASSVSINTGHPLLHVLCTSHVTAHVSLVGAYRTGGTSFTRNRLPVGPWQ